MNYSIITWLFLPKETILLGIFPDNVSTKAVWDFWLVGVFAETQNIHRTTTYTEVHYCSLWLQMYTHSHSKLTCEQRSSDGDHGEGDEVAGVLACVHAARHEVIGHRPHREERLADVRHSGQCERSTRRTRRGTVNHCRPHRHRVHGQYKATLATEKCRYVYSVQ